MKKRNVARPIPTFVLTADPMSGAVADSSPTIGSSASGSSVVLGRSRAGSLRRVKRLRAAVVGAVGCILVSSCGSGSGEDAGPLAFGGAVGELCLPATAAGQYTFGFDTVANRSSNAVLRIERVGLVESRGITLRGAYVMDIADTTLIGTDTRWPPSAAHRVTGVGDARGRRGRRFAGRR